MTSTTPRKIGGYEVHPAAAILPEMSDAERLELRTSIADHGLQLPIVLDTAGRLLDGRHRLQACLLTGKPPRFETYSGDDPIGYVLALNLRRRHLDTSQRAMVAAELLPLYEAEAEARRAAAAERGRARRGVGKFAQTEPEAPDEDNTEPQDEEDEPSPVRARDQAAAQLAVAPRTVESARVVLRDGAPELVAAVRAGAVAVSAAEQLATLSREEQAALVAAADPALVAARAKELRATGQATRRGERIQRMAEAARGNTPLSTGQRYPVILADPPWQYDAPISTSREIENHYPTMSIDEICALPVRDLATEDALLFLWATVPLLPEALRVAEAWGFKYRTHQVWSKTGRTGMGHWLRTEHELLLWCVRGAPPVPPPGERPHSVITAQVGQHSAKPSVFAEQIEALYGPLPKIELFCRSPRAGWTAWGNQAGVSDA